MKIELIAFTDSGLKLGQRLVDLLSEQNYEAKLSSGRKDGTPAKEWVRKAFEAKSALIFIGAAAIAVRLVAPLLQSKAEDPPVIAIDSLGRFVIPLISGHIGGANALAKLMADLLDAQAVITTATDIEGVFAVDSWAVSQGLYIANPEQIKTVAAALLEQKTPLRLYSEIQIEDDPPEEIILCDDITQSDIAISVSDPLSFVDEDQQNAEHLAQILWLVPPVLCAGIGCRRGIKPEQIEALYKEILSQSQLHPKAIEKICSIDIKSNEAGLLTFCEHQHLPLITYSALELHRVKGIFTASSFVASVVGVDNVCERSAVKGSDQGDIVVAKTARHGVTIAIAKRNTVLRFTTG